MAVTTSMPAFRLRNLRWPVVALSAASGLVPHLLVIASAAQVRLMMILLMHAAIVPGFTWFAMRLLENRERNLEEANADLRLVAADLARRNGQIDALNSACRLLAGAPSVADVIHPLTDLIMVVGAARGARLEWNGHPGVQMVSTAGALSEVEGPGQEAIRRFEIWDSGRHLGDLVLLEPSAEAFTEKSVSVVVSEIAAKWHVRTVEGNTLSALSDITARGTGQESLERAEKLIGAVGDAMQAESGALFLKQDGEWVCRASFGATIVGGPKVPPTNHEVWQSAEEGAIYVQSGADAILALYGVASDARPVEPAGAPLLQIVAGYGATLMRLSDGYQENMWAERYRIARELHDDVCQIVASLHMQLGHLGDLIAQGRTGEAERRSIELRAAALDAYDGARAAIDGLRHRPHPNEATNSYIARTAHDICRRADVALEIDAGRVELDQEAAWQLGRIIQEAVGNAVRHGGADRVAIALDQDDVFVRLDVNDNGDSAALGDVVAPANVSHHGLAIMRERLARFGGDVELLRGQAGMVLRVKVPRIGLGTAA